MKIDLTKLPQNENGHIPWKELMESWSINRLDGNGWVRCEKEAK